MSAGATVDSSTFVFSFLKNVLSMGAIILLGACASQKSALKHVQIYNQAAVPDSIDDYLLGPSDEIEISFYFHVKPQKKEYTLGIGDIVKLEFQSNPEFNREATVLPDGSITLITKGKINAIGLTTSQIEQKIVEEYRSIIKEPVVTVMLLDYDHALRQFITGISSTSQGQSRRISIRPDGYLSLPLLDDIRCAGMTLPQLKASVSRSYHDLFSGMEIALSLSEIRNNIVYVIGEVRSPNLYSLDGPTTLMQILSRAGVDMHSAGLGSVLILSRTSDRKPEGKLVDMNMVLKSGNIGSDVLLKQYDVVFVPRSLIADIGLFINQYINALIPNAFRVGVGFNYDLNKYWNNP
jgi:polysaccharide biosynthesis/export protein